MKWLVWNGDKVVKKVGNTPRLIRLVGRNLNRPPSSSATFCNQAWPAKVLAHLCWERVNKYTLILGGTSTPLEPLGTKSRGSYFDASHKPHSNPLATRPSDRDAFAQALTREPENMRESIRGTTITPPGQAGTWVVA
eukprot:scaffold32109_cov21-Tisochrysis_lutea.AAC.2